MRGWIGTMVASVGLAASTAAAQVQPLLVIERAAGEDMVVDGRDAALARAFGMIPSRLRELPSEIPDMDGDSRRAFPGVIDLLEQFMVSPGHFAITYNETNPAGGLFGYGIAGEMRMGDANAASRVHRTVLGLMQQADLPVDPIDSDRFAGMTDIQMPFGLASFGPHEDGYALAIGSVDDVAAGLDSLPAAPANMSPIFRARLDFKGLNAASGLAQGFGGGEPAVGMVIESLEEAGLIGPDAFSVDMISGYTPTHAVTRTVMNNVRQHAEGLSLPTEPLAPDVLRVVPTSAVMGSVASFDTQPLLGTIEALREAGLPVDDALGQFEDMTGVNIENDIIRALGGAAAVYTSDATGGGGLSSAIVMLTFADRERFLDAHGKLVNLANEMIDEETEIGQYVQIEPFTHDGLTYMGVRFKGLPIPLELTYAATDDWLIMGMTPQAVIAAVAQAQGRGDNGIGAVPEIAEAIGRRSPVSVSFMNTRRLAYSGYPIVSLAGSALANGVRSPGSDRDPGIVVPTFNELTSDVRPMIEVNYWDGENLVSHATTDRSVLVQAAGISGALAQFAPVIAAVVVPAMAEAQREFGFNLDTAPDVLPIIAKHAPRLMHLDPIERAMIGAILATDNPAETLDRLTRDID